MSGALEPGVIAQIKDAPDNMDKEHVGKVVTLVELVFAFGTRCWVTNPVMTCRSGYRIGWLPHHLRRLDNPGPDAVDQMVKLVGAAPMTLTEILEGQHG